MQISNINKKVAVTGATGYVASHLIQLLLEKGYEVVGTVRNKNDESKLLHLKELNNASQNLHLVEAQLDQDDDRFEKAFEDCECIFHTASPCFFNGDEDTIVKPAVNGTKNVLNGILKNRETIKNVIFTSSMASVKSREPYPQEYVYTSKDYSDKDFMREKKLWYQLSKTIADEMIVQFKQENPQFGVAIICPTVVLGPSLSKNNFGMTYQQCIADILKGDDYSIGDFMFQYFIDVRDVALLHLNAYEQNIQNDRYLTIAEVYSLEHYGRTLKQVAEELNIKHNVKIRDSKSYQYKYDDSNTKKLLGKPYIPLYQSLKDSIIQLQ